MEQNERIKYLIDYLLAERERTAELPTATVPALPSPIKTACKVLRFAVSLRANFTFPMTVPPK